LKPDVNIRSATLADAAAMLSIYQPFVKETAITFEYEVPSPSDWKSRITTAFEANFPWIVAEHEEKLVGYAYAGRFRVRAAYDWCCESSVYITPEFQRLGIAQKLYDNLFSLLTARGFLNVYAVITLPNAPSVALHQAFGFTETGILNRCGFKQGQWHDVLLMEKILAEHSIPPPKQGAF